MKPMPAVSPVLPKADTQRLHEISRRQDDRLYLGHILEASERIMLYQPVVKSRSTAVSNGMAGRGLRVGAWPRERVCTSSTGLRTR